MTMHHELTCKEIAKMQKTAQRTVSITHGTFSTDMGQLQSKTFRLGADASLNDLWISAEFDDPEFEEAVLRHVYKLLGKRFTRLQSGPIKTHC
jgi:hypothetical protein